MCTAQPPLVSSQDVDFENCTATRLLDRLIVCVGGVIDRRWHTTGYRWWIHLSTGRRVRLASSEGTCPGRVLCAFLRQRLRVERRRHRRRLCVPSLPSKKSKAASITDASIVNSNTKHTNASLRSTPAPPNELLCGTYCFI